MSRQGQFEHGGKTYSYQSELVDTDYGPENRVRIFDPEGKQVCQMQEAAGTLTMIGWWKDEQEMIAEAEADEASLEGYPDDQPPPDEDDLLEDGEDPSESWLRRNPG